MMRPERVLWVTYTTKFIIPVDFALLFLRTALLDNSCFKNQSTLWKHPKSVIFFKLILSVAICFNTSKGLNITNSVLLLKQQLLLNCHV